MNKEEVDEASCLKELAVLFTRLGIIGFGGPAVHIALMEEEVVRKRNWMDHQHFLDLVGATNLIPGPNSTEMTMHIGQERAGWKGLIVAGSCFILPAVIITAVFALAYYRYGQLPEVQPFIYAIKPAIISVILVTMIALAKKALKSVQLGIIGCLAAIAVLMGCNEIYVLFGAGLAGLLIYLALDKKTTIPGIIPFTCLQINNPVTNHPSSMHVLLIFLKIGAILYGSGYILFAFLDAELVAKGLLTQRQLIDAIAVGQFTPGPVFSSATFIGWQMGGLGSALAATAGIFLPSFLLVALLNPLIPKLRRSKLMGTFLDTVNIASVAIILSVVIEMGKATLLDWRTLLISLVACIVTWCFKRLNTAFIILGGSVLGYVLSFF